MAKLLSNTRIYGTGTVDTQLFVQGFRSAHSTASGSLQVSGGIGVSGGGFFGGTVTATNFVGAISGTASLANDLVGGTAGQLVYQVGANDSGFVGPGTAGQLLVSAGAAAPVYTNTGSIYVNGAVNAQNIFGGTAGQLLYQSSAGVTAFAGPGTAGQVLTSGGAGAPVYVNTSSLHVGRAVSVDSFSGNAGSATNIQGGTAGQVPYQTGAGATSFFGPGTAGQILVSAGTSAPTYTNTGSIYVNRSTLSDNDSGGAAGGLRYQTGANASTFLSIGTAGQVLTVNSSANAPQWTNTSSFYAGFANQANHILGGTAGQILYQSAAGTTAFAGPGTAGQILVSAGTSAPTYTNTGSIYIGRAVLADSSTAATAATNISGGTAGQLHYQSSPGVTAFAGPGTAGQILVSAGTSAPTYTNTSSIYVNRATLADNDSGGAAGGLRYQTGANASTFLSIGTADQILRVNSGATAPEWVSTSTLYVNRAVTADSATGNAGSVSTQQQTTNAAYYPTFVDANNASATAELLYTNSALSFNPSTGRVGISTTTPLVSLDVRGIIQGQSYQIPDTGATTQWTRVGTLTIPQGGYTARIRAYIHAGYNASNGQDFYIDIFFKTSNNSSVDGNGFAGNSWYHSRGFNSTDPTPKWVANAAGISATSYDLYLSLPNYTNRSHYVVEQVQGTVWTNVGTTGHTDPGSGSATVCVSSVGLNIPLGNVGIGNVSPAHKLDITGTGRASSDFRAPLFYDSNDTTYYIDPASTSIVNTLISGTATPTGSTIGGVRAYGSGNAYMGASDASGRTAFFGVDSSGYAMFGALTNHDTVLRANNTEYLRVHTAGYTTISGSARSPIFYDSNNTAYYTDPASTSSLNYAVIRNAISAEGYRFVNPEGAQYVTGSSTVTGAIKIKLPTGRLNSSTMLRFTVRLYEYNTGRSTTWEIGGYNYVLGSWYNVFATQLTDSGRGAFTVRFGQDSTSDCIWIGETSTSWSYPQVFVTDVQTGYSGFSNDWGAGWAVSFVTSFDTVEDTRTASLILCSNNANASVPSLGVGTAASGTTGEIRATNEITAYYSDRRLKENVETITDALSKVKSLHGIRYTGNDLAVTFGYSKDKKLVGLFADEVEAVLPEAVRLAPFDSGENNTSKSGENYKTIQYEKLVPLLIEAIKEQSNKMDKLQEEIAELRDKLSANK